MKISILIDFSQNGNYEAFFFTFKFHTLIKYKVSTILITFSMQNIIINENFSLAKIKSATYLILIQLKIIKGV